MRKWILHDVGSATVLCCAGGGWVWFCYVREGGGREDGGF